MLMCSCVVLCAHACVIYESYNMINGHVYMSRDTRTCACVQAGDGDVCMCHLEHELLQVPTTTKPKPQTLNPKHTSRVSHERPAAFKTAPAPPFYQI